MGGMAAQIPIKDDPDANAERDGEGARRQAARGARGARRHLGGAPGAGRRSRSRSSTKGCRSRTSSTACAKTSIVDAAALLEPPTGTRTEAGLRHNIRVGIQYLEAWLGGQGAVPIYNLMEDAATAEISRTQIWQWIQHGATLDDGRVVTRPLVKQLIAEEVDRSVAGRDASVRTGRHLGGDLLDFLTLPAYETLVKHS